MLDMAVAVEDMAVAVQDIVVAAIEALMAVEAVLSVLVLAATTEERGSLIFLATLELQPPLELEQEGQGVDLSQRRPALPPTSQCASQSLRRAAGVCRGRSAPQLQLSSAALFPSRNVNLFQNK